MSVHSKTGSFKKFSCCLDLQSSFQKKRITFEVHKNPIFGVFPSTSCALKPGVLQAITAVFEEQTFSHGEKVGCGLALTQVAGKEAHLWSDQQKGLWEAAMEAGFQELDGACCYAL